MSLEAGLAYAHLLAILTMVVFLASDESAFVSGQSYVIDGGITILQFLGQKIVIGCRTVWGEFAHNRNVGVCAREVGEHLLPYAWMVRFPGYKPNRDGRLRCRDGRIGRCLRTRGAGAADEQGEYQQADPAGHRSRRRSGRVLDALP